LGGKLAPEILQYVFAADAAAPATAQRAARRAPECLSVEAFDGGVFGTSLFEDDNANAKKSLDALFAPLK
jgi:hypothetical protein